MRVCVCVHVAGFSGFDLSGLRGQCEREIFRGLDKLLLENSGGSTLFLLFVYSFPQIHLPGARLNFKGVWGGGGLIFSFLFFSEKENTCVLIF